MANTKLFYSYKESGKNGENKPIYGKVPIEALSAYSDSIIFDEDNRRIWHNGVQYGNTYWGSTYGETFNAVNLNTAGNYAHAEGYDTTAKGENSHAEGYNAIANGYCSHAEGYSTHTFGAYTHAEGYMTIASGTYAHAEGYKTNASGAYSHAEGSNTIASGEASHAQGAYTYAKNAYESAFGYYNSSIENETIFTVGYGDSDTNRKNIFELRTDGTAYLNGRTYIKDTTYIGSSSHISDNSAYLDSVTCTKDIYWGEDKNSLSDAYTYLDNECNNIKATYVGTYPNSKFNNLYIWTGTQSELPTDRYANVIYIIISDDESTQNNIYPPIN